MRGTVGGFGMEPEWRGSQSVWTHVAGVSALGKEPDPEDEPGDVAFDDDDLDEGELGAELDDDDLDGDDDLLDDDDDLDDDDLDDLDDDLIDLDDEYDTADEPERGPATPRKYDD